MNKNSEDLLIRVTDFILDSLVENELVKEIPVIGTSYKFIGAIRSLDIAYIKKVNTFFKSSR